MSSVLAFGLPRLPPTLTLRYGDDHPILIRRQSLPICIYISPPKLKNCYTKGDPRLDASRITHQYILPRIYLLLLTSWNESLAAYDEQGKK